MTSHAMRLMIADGVLPVAVRVTGRVAMEVWEETRVSAVAMVVAGTWGMAVQAIVAETVLITVSATV